jgi:fructose/tagatose bisphosphate aldolase
MPVPDFKTYCAILDRARAGHFALPAVYDPRSYLALAETAMVERVKQPASDLRASGKTTCAS